MRWRVQPSSVGGSTRVPGDKSIGHRALMLAGMAAGESRIDGVPGGEDVRSTARCMAALGAQIEWTGDTARITGTGTLAAPRDHLDAGNSGTTMRLLTGVLAAQPFDSCLVGDESLSRRPMNRVVEPLRRMGAEIGTNDGRAPLAISGRHLTGIDYVLPVPSAQIKSALLLAGLFAEGETRVHEPIPSRDHTERMLKALGVQLGRTDGALTVRGGDSPLASFSLTVPGDVSSAAFLLTAALLTGGEIEVEGVGVNPTRTGFLETLRGSGAEIENRMRDEDLGEPRANVRAVGTLRRPVRIEADDVPLLVDEIPLAALVATQAEGTSVIMGAQELRVKETDRIAAVARALNLMGASVTERPDGFQIHGPTPLRGARVTSYGDHRIAMMLAVAGTIAAGETVIDGAEAAAISYPEFAETFRRLGARIDVD
jgi:3-phosphoshikimate 1-carboxyvinyltransferase